MNIIRVMIIGLLVIAGHAHHAMGASAVDEAEFDKMLASYNPSGIDSELLAREFSDRVSEQLKKLGSAEQNRAAVWRVLKDKNKKSLWGAAMDISQRLGVSQIEIYSWAKANIDDIAMLRDGLAHFRLKDLISFSGTKTDVERLLVLADGLPLAEKEQADLIRRTAQSIHFRSDPFPESKQAAPPQIDQKKVIEPPPSGSGTGTQPVQAQPPSNPVESKQDGKKG